MVTRRGVFLLAVLGAVSFVGCHKSLPKWPPSTFNDRSYVDLQPGWRIRVVVPIVESGGYKVRTVETRNSDGTVSRQTEKGFLGYETDYYQVNSRDGGKPFITFELAEFTGTHQNKTKKPEPVLPLFMFPGGISYARLLFLTRVAETDHDSAVLAA